jgi:hypothetical protein
MRIRAELDEPRSRDADWSMPIRRPSAPRRVLAAACLAASLAACASRGGARESTAAAATRGKHDPNLITAEELTHGQWANAYDAVRSLRPQWLNFKGADTILGEQGEVQVRLDDSPLGGIASLRQVNSVGIASMRFIDVITAAGRWGGAYANGAILISVMKR